MIKLQLLDILVCSQLTITQNGFIIEAVFSFPTTTYLLSCFSAAAFLSEKNHTWLFPWIFECRWKVMYSFSYLVLSGNFTPMHPVRLFQIVGLSDYLCCPTISNSWTVKVVGQSDYLKQSDSSTRTSKCQQQLKKLTPSTIQLETISRNNPNAPKRILKVRYFILEM